MDKRGKRTRQLPTKTSNVKSYVTKKGVYVKSHNRKQHFNPNKKEKDFNFTDKDIKNIEIVQPGISNGTIRFEAKGNNYYFKPRDGEVFINKDGWKIRNSINLHDKQGERVLTIRQVEEIQKNKKFNEATGQLMNREDAAYILSRELGMDFLAPVDIMNIKGKDGIVSKSVYDHYKDKYDEILTPDNQLLAGDIAKYPNYEQALLADKYIKDKILFDELIGNVDRNRNNTFVGVKKDGSLEMIGIDNAYSFPSDNVIYNQVDGAYREFQRYHFNKQGGTVSSEFKNAVKSFYYNKEKFNTFLKYIESKIGKMETKAFVERYERIMKKQKP